VILAACKVILQNVVHIEDADLRKQVNKKLAAPLVTMLSSEPEI